MQVSPQKPFKIVYSLFQHEYLGYLFESFAVQLDDNGRLSLQSQNISFKNAKDFEQGMDDADKKLVKLIDETQQDAIFKKFATNKKQNITDFFTKIYDVQKPEKAIQDQINHYIERRMVEIISLIPTKPIFEMGSDGEATHRQLMLAKEAASIWFHFHRNELSTHYFPTIFYEGQKLDFQYKKAIVMSNEPACLLLDRVLYTFKQPIDGNKIKPFLNKNHIIIPRAMEETYFNKFLKPMIATSEDIYAQGFTIKKENYKPKGILVFRELITETSRVLMPIFADNEEDSIEEADHAEATSTTFELMFCYGENEPISAKEQQKVIVSMLNLEENYEFVRTKRDIETEKKITNLLNTLGLNIALGQATMPHYEAITWLGENIEKLEEFEIEVIQKTGETRYFLGKSSLNLSIKENNDWFDIYANVLFGEFEIPFLKIRQLIIQKKREFRLPNGEIAVIPEAWFTEYSDIFALSNPQESGETHLTKAHFLLINKLKESELAAVNISERLESLRDFSKIDSYPLPKSFKGVLRPYQKAGYDWMRFLNQYKLGGCLADDMGLGKTVQTLALLQSQKEAGIKRASLLVMPTSLVYNWEMEAKKFTTGLKIMNYTGTDREKSVEFFDYFDIILTSYGIVRLDIEVLKKYEFNYLILDESQAIKNPSSNIARSLMQIGAMHKLILTGTPLENSTLDLWSQMNFINEGLLGTQTYFRNEYQTPIERKNDEIKLQKLHTIIKPFILRRHKSQVARELPAKMENIHYSQMSEEQASEYEEAKSFFRNKILEHIEEKGMAQSQILLLQGLTQLRQLANHPKMVKEDYDGSSGKLKDITYKLENIIKEKHKVLIFSQFVKHLSILRDYLDTNNVKYAYLDGSTRDRQEQVQQFQQEPDCRVFLISLKAGGVGLNLTAADYVFILDPWWNPAVEAQAIDRAHRIGQDKTVFVYKFISKDSVEEKILALQQNKLKLAGDLIITEDNFVKVLTQHDIADLLA